MGSSEEGDSEGAPAGYHVSSFIAGEVVNAPRGMDPLIYGFETQVKHVSVGIKAVLERSRRESLNTW